MYLFFDQYSEACTLLERTLKAIKADYTFVIGEDQFFLPDNYVSLPEYIIGRYENIVHEEKALDYGFVDVPEFWQIRAEEGVANIYNMGQLKGVIASREYKNHRVVTKVKWLLETKRVYKTDYYNKYGFACCKVWKNADGRDILKNYYTKAGEEIISYHLQSGAIHITEKGSVSRTFASEKELLQDVFEELIRANETIVVSSVSHVELLRKIDVEGMANVVVVFHSTEELKAYRELCAEGRKYPAFLINSFQTSNTELVADEYRLSYISNTERVESAGKNALIVTTTDWLIGIEELISNVPEVTFDIAANTLVSEKILSLGNYPNVRIHTCIDEIQMRDLMKSASFYLDINNARELFNVICEAHMSDLLILGQKQTMHNPQYVLQECYFDENSLGEMIVLLRQLNEDKQMYGEYVGKQKQRALDTVQNFAIQLGLREE